MSRFASGMSSFAIRSGKPIASFLVFMLTACGPSAPEYHPAEPRVISGTAAKTQPIETGNPPVATNNDSDASTPMVSDKSTPVPEESKTPTPVPLSPPRTTPNDVEKTAMANLYAAPNNQGGCAGCHGALNASEKKGRTAQQIANAQTILPHRTVAAANKWPKDTADASNDGVDSAQLFLSAMVEILK